MVVFLGWVLLNIYSNHPSENQSYLIDLYDKLFVPFCLYWWVRSSAPSEQYLKQLIPGAFALVIFEVVIGLLSWLRREMLPVQWVGYLNNRTIGTLRWAHAYSITLVFFSLLLFQAAMYQKSRATRLTLLFAVGVGFVGVFLSFSRGAWLGGVAALVGLLYLYPKPVLRLAVVVLIIMSILGSTVLSKQIAYANQRLNSEGTAIVRFVIWDAGMQLIERKPFFGWGYGDYTSNVGQFQRQVFNSEATYAVPSHNTFISFAAELGVPGLLLYLFPAMWWLGISFKRWQFLPQTGFWSRKLLIIFWLLLLAHSITSFFSDIRVSTYGLSLWWVSLGWIATMVVPLRTLYRQTT
jgi:O-antigen ligase